MWVKSHPFIADGFFGEFLFFIVCRESDIADVLFAQERKEGVDGSARLERLVGKHADSLLV